ncbi:hypothetical protein QBC46DRAFT_354517 [Diplogelasinospora grovesii]|uniref:Uncharacterized protein n=1 Tax=Diplogelasinospora grovesii TaxID=303347 RepID=A0AAN6N6A3_9PEZI|nr:hypothetical protein QBC46DRAFT_354517 [Diplogelasinospora grovesii]
MSNSTASGDIRGWVFDCGSRGTLDIVYGCIVVLVSAIWTVVHLNVPAKGESDWRVFLRRTRWGLVSIFAPDFLTLVAASQWESAKKSLQQMRQLSEASQWGLEHSFYANSGGFVLQTPDTEPFPINGASLYYLVSKGYIALPSITREEIWDKSKADVFAKGLAILQGTWIIIQSIARAVQKLPLTPLELFTLAFVVSTTMSYYFWWRKPQHVGVPTVIDCMVPMSQILVDAGYAPDAPYTDTPMDFIEKQSESWKRRPLFERFDLECGRKEPTQACGDAAVSKESPEASVCGKSALRHIKSNETFTIVEEPESIPSPGEISTPRPVASTETLKDNFETGIVRRDTEDTLVMSPLSSRAPTLVAHENTKSTLSLRGADKKLKSLLEDDSLSEKEKQDSRTTQVRTQRPAGRIADDSILPGRRLPLKLLAMLIIPSLIHSSIHLVGWNLEFPTSLEQNLWRGSVIILASMSCVSVGMVRVLRVIGYQGEYSLVWVWVNADARESKRKSVIAQTGANMAGFMGIRNWTWPGFWDVVLSLSTLSLVVARIYLITEVCISLRQQPAKVYVDIDWTGFIPHI